MAEVDVSYSVDELEDGPQDAFVCGGEDPRDPELEECILDERSVYQGHIIDLHELDVRLPNGDLAKRDVVRHPGAVAIVALTDDARVVLVRQYRAALGRVTVEIPAGKLDPGEDIEACARRELSEETGITADYLAQLTTIATSAGFSDELIHIFMATGLHFEGAHPDDDEFLGVCLVDMGEFIDAVLDGRVEDAKTVVGALAVDAIGRRLEAMVADDVEDTTGAADTAAGAAGAAGAAEKDGAAC
jgi:ADP-ribose pyrophosphatase